MNKSNQTEAQQQEQPFSRGDTCGAAVDLPSLSRMCVPSLAAMPAPVNTYRRCQRFTRSKGGRSTAARRRLCLVGISYSADTEPDQ